MRYQISGVVGIRVTLGELFEIGLGERPTTGFRWRLVEVPDGIELIDTA
jgi:predicted secreted protein